MSAQNPRLPVVRKGLFAGAPGKSRGQSTPASGWAIATRYFIAWAIAWCFVFAKPVVCEATGIISFGSGRAIAGPPQAHISLAKIHYPIVDGTDIRFSRPEGPQGLSLTKLGPVVQDNEGFLWFGSQHGLYRFDGYNYKEFVHDPASPNSLSGVFISTLFKDRDGVLWVGCDRFLDRLDLATEQFTHYAVPFVLRISQDRSGLLWLSTPSGLYSFDPKTTQSHRYGHDSADSFSLSSNNVRSSAEDREGRLWVSTVEGMDELDRSSGKVLLHLPLREPSHSFEFFEDRLGTFWIYRESGNPLAIFDPASQTITEFSFDRKDPSDAVPTSITAMAEDQNGTLWLGTIGAGLLKFDRDHKKFIRYRHNVADSESIAQDSIGYLELDREGIMWAALGGMGLTSFTVEPRPFKRYRHDFGDPNIKGEPFVGAILVDENGIVWIGSHEALNRIDRTSKRYSSYRLGNLGEGSDVISLCQDRSGDIWAGTYGHGLFRFDRKTGKSKRYRHDPSDRNSLSDDIVPRLLLDHNGTLWAATDDGLDRFDDVRQRFTTYTRSKLVRDHYLELVEDGDGTLWLGTDSSGLQRFNPADGHFTVYEHDSSRLGTLSDNRVNSVHIGSTGRIWVGTQDGLDELDRTRGRFTSYSRHNGLPGNTVGCVLEDRLGTLWMSTNNGVASFNQASNSFAAYSIADGLPGLDLTGWGACFRSASGEMFFGGFAGATAFYPDQVRESPSAPLIALTDLRVFGKSVEVAGGTILRKAINYSDSVTLNYKERAFAIGFSALSFANPATNRYRYMLEGLDPHWNEAGSDERLASYTTLPHGVYRFRVQGAESHGAWTEPGRELTIEILPPWWLTNWFRALFALVVFITLSMLYRLRMGRLEKQFQKAFEARVDERMRIARDLHDTLLQSVNALLLRLLTVSNVLPARPDEAKRRIDRAIDEASGAITEGRDTLSELRSTGTPAIDLDEAISGFARELLNSSGSQLLPEIHVQVEGTPVGMNPMVRDEVYRIVTESIRNAIRHANATRIDVELRYDLQKFRARIGDNGAGIDPSVLNLDHKAGHWGLRGMRERAKLVGGALEVWSQLNTGTEVGVTIPAASAYAKPSAVWSVFSYFRRN